MALQWDFKEKAGTVTQVYGGKEHTSNFYEGNAIMIVTNEFEEDGKQYYEVIWFFTGEEHAKRCLGLAKLPDGTKSNMFEKDGQVVRMTIYRDHCHGWRKLADLFVKAFPDIEIDLRAAEADAITKGA